MEKNKRIPLLIYRHLTGTITDDERKELTAWLDASESNRRAFNQLCDPGFQKREYRRMKAIDPHRAFADMTARIRQDGEKQHGQVKTIAMRIAQAAAVVLLVLGAYTYYNKVANTRSGIQLAEVKTDVITHGSTQALMTLDNGRTIPLSDNDEQNENLIAQAEAKEEVKEIKLSTPRGGEFKITLEDGTEVWLNADTQLRYPETFDAKERRVAVTGEAYFHVAKDADRPFYVETAGQVVRVYGTEFNVHSYKEDDMVATTLVEGSISLTQMGGNGAELLLTPGHQALFNKHSAETKVKSIDTSVVTSWRSDRFVFEDNTLEQIMQTLGRWYDFDYIFEDRELAQTLFMGSVPRYGEFSDVLAILEKSGGLGFRQDGHTIIIQHKKSK